MSDHTEDYRVSKHMAGEISKLEVEMARLVQEIQYLRMFAPARRATKNTEPAKAIGPCNTAYWFGPGYTEEQEAAIDADETGELNGWHPIDED